MFNQADKTLPTRTDKQGVENTKMGNRLEKFGINHSNYGKKDTILESLEDINPDYLDGFDEANIDELATILSFDCNEPDKAIRDGRAYSMGEMQDEWINEYQTTTIDQSMGEAHARMMSNGLFDTKDLGHWSTTRVNSVNFESRHIFNQDKRDDYTDRVFRKARNVAAQSLVNSKIGGKAFAKIALCNKGYLKQDNDLMIKQYRSWVVAGQPTYKQQQQAKRIKVEQQAINKVIKRKETPLQKRMRLALARKAS